MTKEESKIIREDLIKKSETLDSEDFIVYVQSHYGEIDLTDAALVIIFKKVSEIDENGYGLKWEICDLIDIHHSYKTTNGGSWYRKDGPLGKEFNISITRKGNKAETIKLDGKNKDRITMQKRNINTKIVKELKKEKCVILAIGSQIEIDHKNGKYNDTELLDVKTQKKEDFQPLSKAANNAKRTHCKRCKESGKRFDAKQLGYKESFICGDESSPNCEGCYWYDPKKFNEEISKDYKKNR